MECRAAGGEFGVEIGEYRGVVRIRRRVVSAASARAALRRGVRRGATDDGVGHDRARARQICEVAAVAVTREALRRADACHYFYLRHRSGFSARHDDRTDSRRGASGRGGQIPDPRNAPAEEWNP